MTEKSSIAVINAHDFFDRIVHAEDALSERSAKYERQLEMLSELKKNLPEGDESFSELIIKQIEQGDMIKTLITSVKIAIGKIFSFGKNHPEAKSEVNLSSEIENDLETERTALNFLRSIRLPQNQAALQEIIKALEKNIAAIEKTIKESELRQKYETMIAGFQDEFRDKLSQTLGIKITFVATADQSSKAGQQPTHCLKIAETVFSDNDKIINLGLEAISKAERH